MLTSKRRSKTFYKVSWFGMADFCVEIWRGTMFVNWLTRKDGDIRIFSTPNGARKAIWRERNHEYHL